MSAVLCILGIVGFTLLAIKLSTRKGEPHPDNK